MTISLINTHTFLQRLASLLYCNAFRNKPVSTLNLKDVPPTSFNFKVNID